MNVFSFVTVYFCIGFPILLPAAPTPLKVELSAKAAILINAETGGVLYEKNAQEQMYPASITKLITAMYLLEKKGDALDELVTASSEAVVAVPAHVKRTQADKHPPYRLEFGGTHMGIKIGEILPLRVLLYGMMLASGNDASNVIAQHISGNISQFIEELNAFVQNKGCTKTRLYTPHGLPHADHKTTAHDMAILAKEAIRNPLLRQVVKTPMFVRPATNKQPETQMYQHNALVKPGSRFYYPKAIGIKTGYTKAAGYTLIGAAEDAQRKLIAIVLGCETMEQRYKDAIALFEAAFNEKKIARTLFAKGFDVFSTHLKGGKQPLKATLANDLILDFYPSEDQKFQHKVQWEKPSLPILQGQKVGWVEILSDAGLVLKQSPLFATNPVAADWEYAFQAQWKKCKERMASQFSLILSLIGCAFLSGAFLLFYKKTRKADL